MAHEVGVTSNSKRAGYSRYWPMLAMGVLMLLTWTAVAVDYAYVRPQFVTVPLRKMQSFQDMTFTNTTLEVDGKAFIRCKFNNVRLRFRGEKEFALKDNTFDGPAVFETTNLSANLWVSAVVQLLRDGKFVNLNEVGFGRNDEITMFSRH